ncbi:DUF11 domain-containing protein [Vreelandella aquamarina]|uniref:hypothetical protein n=1 Tax=Vreelandella aquamarina TaxID=77097 RepID=UPI00384BE1B0
MNLHFRKTPLAMVVAGLALGAVASGQAWALTPAGTEINNIATVTYEDENGNTYSAQSNESTVTVAKVYAAELEDDNEKTGAPGSTVYFPHVLTNTGNTEDTFDISSIDDDTDEEYTVYEDLNGNGLPDAGEPEVTELTLSGGERADLVVAKPVPSSAADGDTIESTLTVESQNDGTVEDVGDNGDGLDGTNQDTVTVTDGPVIVPTKQSEVNDDGTITYTLTVKNTGSAAEDVVILDLIPENTTFVSVDEVNGLVDPNDTYDGGNVLDPGNYDGSLATVEENGVDMNGNGADSDSGEGLSFIDAEMGPGVEVSIKFTVEFEEDLEAGTEANNRFAAGEEDPNNSGSILDPESSNKVTDEVEQTFGPDATDTGDNTGDDTGTDADGDNDQARVNEAAAGSTVSFTNVITNNGNGDDTFELSIENGLDAGYTGADSNLDDKPFPDGTTFTFYNGNDTSPLTDTNGDGNVDTGSLATGEELEITVRANLPSDASGTGDFVATTTVTSANDPSDEPASDQKLEVLGNITAPSIDLANSFSSELTGSDDADAYVATAPITTESAGVGDTVTFDLFAANNGGSSDSFVLDADLPEGWNVTFREVGVIPDGGSAVSDPTPGATVTATPLLPAGAVYQYVAEVDISSVTDQALADFEGSIDSSAAGGSGTINNIDGDYPVRFTIESNATNQSDEKLDAVDVDSDRNIAVTPSGENQVEPGGSVEYSHEIANRGNTTEDVTLTTENDADGFSNNTQVFVENTGWVNIANLTDGDTVSVRTPDGSFTDVEIGKDGDDTVVTLGPGERLDVKTTVFAPANASQGDKDTYTLTATTADGSISDIATDTTEVITGQVRLEKTAYVDTACDCAMPYDTTSTNFAAEPEDQVEPGQCVVWNLEARNEGTTEAKNVTINDSVTEFTTLVEADDSTVTAIQNGDDLTWEIGDLASGASASAQFCVKVD